MNKIKKLIKNIKKVSKKLKDPFWRAKSKYIVYYDKFQIDEKLILLESEHGKKIDGNIFYMLKYISQSEKYSSYKIYVSAMGRNLRKFRNILDLHGMSKVQLVMLASDEYFKYLASAKFLINDTSFGSYFMKKEGQIYLNTWHGTPLKALGKSDRSNYYNIGNIQKNFMASDYLLYPNKYTMQHMIEDYMLENICKSKCLLAGYPRNEIFFDENARDMLREKLEISEYKIYMYMPTYRGNFNDKKDTKGYIYLSYYLYEIDKLLDESELLYVNLHPLEQKGIDFKKFKHIKQFPEDYEVYEFLNIADVLITDYSSVFFDFALTKRKIVLFTYDEDEYLKDRGMYLNISELPFPKVKNIEDLFKELRSSKIYDDTLFCKTYCEYDSPNASQKLCDYLILGESNDLDTIQIYDNCKENVLLYAGNLAANGITTSLRNLLNTIDLEKRNYYITFSQDMVGLKNAENIKSFSNKVNYYVTTGDMNITIIERVVRKLFKKQIILAKVYMFFMEKRISQDFYRNYGNLRLNSIIQYNGYENEVILKFSTFSGLKSIFVHNDMIREIQLKGNQRRDVLNYAYNKYDNVAVVTKDLLESTNKITGKNKAIIVKNTINYSDILEKSKTKIILDKNTKISCSYEIFEKMIYSNSPKLINIGRFSPEKGHERLINSFYKFIQNNEINAYLIIMGGYSINNGYEITLNQVRNLGIGDKVILIENVSNPYPILKACDYFILSSYYEGFGLVLVEADILQKPIVSTDITGPRSFMKENGGTLVEDNDDGIYHGIELLLSGKIEPLTVDYALYNESVKKEFEEIF